MYTLLCANRTENAIPWLRSIPCLGRRLILQRNHSWDVEGEAYQRVLKHTECEESQDDRNCKISYWFDADLAVLRDTYLAHELIKFDEERCLLDVSHCHCRIQYRNNRFQNVLQSVLELLLLIFVKHTNCL